MMGYEQALIDLAVADERVVVMTAENRAAIRSLPGVIQDRFIDVGICEQTLVGSAAGLALRGRIPVVHALAAFLTMRAFEFIRTDVGLGSLPVKLVGGVPGFLSDANGPTHQAIEDISLMRGIPGMQVFCPADEEDLVIGLEPMLREPWPTYIRHNPLPAVYSHDREFKPGKAELVSNGSDVTILVYGMLFNQAYEATDLLEWQGISVRLINLRTLKPIDEECVLAAMQETKLIVTLEDHFITGGLFSIASEIAAQNGIGPKILPMGLVNRWFTPATLPRVLASEGFTSQQIANRISRHMH